MQAYYAEFIGTALLVLLGNGVVANVVLRGTKGHNSGWIVVTAGWGFAVAIAAYCVNAISGAHLNPAVTLGLAAIDRFDWANVPEYVAAQVLGGIFGAMLVWLTYLPHWALTEDTDAKRAAFCTSPAIRDVIANLIAEIIGTFVLVLGILTIVSPANMQKGIGWGLAIGPFLVGILVWSIGLSLGGPTGYAINPARDLGPRIAHFLLPIAGKGSSDWSYAWVPILGPLLGGVAGAKVYQWLWPLTQ